MYEKRLHASSLGENGFVPPKVVFSGLKDFDPDVRPQGFSFSVPGRFIRRLDEDEKKSTGACDNVAGRTQTYEVEFNPQPVKLKELYGEEIKAYARAQWDC